MTYDPESKYLIKVTSEQMVEIGSMGIEYELFTAEDRDNIFKEERLSLLQKVREGIEARRLEALKYPLMDSNLKEMKDFNNGYDKGLSYAEEFIKTFNEIEHE